MIDTDVSLFKELIQGYSSALKKIEEYNNDIISNFNELSKYWHDSKSLKLNSSVKLEIQRMVNLESNIKGLYPCGEGSGYAGGITSSAIDGIKVFESIARTYKN